MTDFLIKLFVKDNQDTTSSRVRESHGNVASIVGIATNFLLFLIKAATGLIFNSIAILADAVNNLSDSGSSLVTLIGFRLASKPPDAEHPYGHARMEYISGLVVSFLILFLGLQLLKSSVVKIFNPEAAEFSLVSVFVLVVSILLKLWLSRFFSTIGNKIDSTTLMATAMDSRNDVLATSAVLLAAIISYFTGFNLDGYMGAAVAGFILFSGYNLVLETISPLLGMAPNKELVDHINEEILSYEGIIGLHDLAVHSYGPGRYFASVHCEVPAEEDIMVSHDIIDNIERDFLSKHGINLVIHLDPIVTSDEKTNELRARVEGLIQEFSPDLGMHDFRVVWGKSHSNLIFDVVVPFDFKYSDAELTELIAKRINQINPAYYAVITIDHVYVPRPSL